MWPAVYLFEGIVDFGGYFDKTPLTKIEPFAAFASFTPQSFGAGDAFLSPILWGGGETKIPAKELPLDSSSITRN
ncbi:MAG: hypothetical protein EA411_02750 [Saprospirales bacterium]|nr:MAG: hypothetical protein EA411_02750 [Saprospirales bacterium]